MFDHELESFKTIDLRAYAASNHGYVIDLTESWSGSAVMRHPNGDKIVIKRDAADGHFVFFSVRDESDNGSIIDFIQKRLGCKLGAVRKELRAFGGGPAAALPSYSPLPVTRKERLRVEIEFTKMQDASRHPYLEGERCIAAELLAQERFAGSIRIDARGNAVFPHFDQNGLCGFEKKNTGFTGFSSGGTKGLWLSHSQTDDERLVFAESAIDALSHALLFPDPHARYASTGGKLNPSQPELIRAAIARMPAGSEIVAAMDADAAGRALAQIIGRAVELSGRCDLRFRIHEPEGEKDWNDVLRAKRRLFHVTSRPSVARPA